MRRTKLAAAAAASLVSAALAVPLTTAEVGAAPAARPQAGEDATATVSDDLRAPKWRVKEDALRQAAVEQRLRDGGDGGVEKLARGQYARVAQTGKDKIFVVLAEFGNRRHSAYCDSSEEGACLVPSDPSPEGAPQKFNGPRHNQIPQPDRTVDNSTLWEPDFDADHYRNLYFNRMRKFYEQQSMGRYSIDGQVTEWVRVPFNQARYGRSYFCGSSNCTNVWFLIRDALAYWTRGQLASGKTMPEIRDHLATFDVQDRYDFDEDGDFREPDGYIDHFQVVHAGGDEADSDPVYGDDAIWSHRWNAQINPSGTGPAGGAQIGGVEIGEGGVSDPDGANITVPDNRTGVWVNDYTMQPENGGLSVFAHEFAHDLGLPDLYDTSGNAGGAENSTGFWTLMSQSRGTAQGDPGIGDRPMPFGAWEKFQLGWLDYKTFRPGHDDRAVLRPGQSLSDRHRNGAIVLLPDKQVPLDLGAPCTSCGERFYWSRSGDDLDHAMTTAVDGGGPLTAQVRYSVEEGYDYAFLEYTSDGGETWEPLETSESYSGPDGSGENTSGAGITGESGGWVALTATVPDDAEGIRWHYVTDPAVTEDGFQVDNITLDGTVIGDAETDDGWSLDGFIRTTGSDTVPYLNAYFVDNRQYVGRDKLLKHVYNYGFQDVPEFFNAKVEFYRYQPGALISYWDTSYNDNNVGDHPGHGQLLPVDAHVQLAHQADGTLARPRTQAYDATFSRVPTEAQRLHNLSEPFKLTAKRAVPVFDDTLDWWFGTDEHGTEDHPGRYQPEWNSVDVPKTGTVIKVKKVQKDKDMVIEVTTSD